jgi:glycosyltransferase involved in cell wall biosynthesis
MRRRLLMLGPVNHPHVEHLALALRDRGFEVTVAGDAEAELPASSLPAAGVRVRAAPPRPRRTPVGAAAHVRWIRRLCREETPDVVHAHWLCGFAALAAVADASPLVAMAWGSDVLRAGRVKTLANRIALRRARLALADSGAVLDRMVALGARPDTARLVSWGVDLEAFTPPSEPRTRLRARLGLGAGPVVLSPRSLTPVYNPATIMAAFERVRARVPDAQLVLKHMSAGPPPALAAGEGVHVVGHVPYARMADYYRAADVCVSIPSSDSAPRSVWEAMACGCPVVLSDLPWVREQIEPAVDALLVPVDAGAVGAALTRVLTDPALARRLGQRGRALVEARHDREVEMDRLAHLLTTVAA